MNEDILTNVNEVSVAGRNEPSSYDNNDLAGLKIFLLTLQSRTQLANAMDFTLRVRYDTPIPKPFQHTSRDLDARKRDKHRQGHSLQLTQLSSPSSLEPLHRGRSNLLFA